MVGWNLEKVSQDKRVLAAEEKKFTEEFNKRKQERTTAMKKDEDALKDAKGKVTENANLIKAKKEKIADEKDAKKKGDLEKELKALEDKTAGLEKTKDEAFKAVENFLYNQGMDEVFL